MRSPSAQAMSMLLNIIMTPFMGKNNQSSFVPPTCSNVVVKMGENELKASLTPRGNCSNCCPVRTGIDLRFVLYNKRHPARGVLIQPSNEAGAARRAGVDPHVPTEIFIHGFTEVSPGQSGRALVDAYMDREEPMNVILLDWSNLASFPWYPIAVNNVRVVAQALKTFLEVFDASGEIPIKNVHVIGFSLGSHIASFAGKQLKPGMKIPRITALDPALPEYSLEDKSGRLTRDDADYVDVIHTDSGVFGIPISIGHADFYPNGGRALQPGCQPSYIIRLNILDQILACSHVRAWRLYAESVRDPEAFPATKCHLWRGPNKVCNFTKDAVMGYGTTKDTEGQFFLITHPVPPYGKSPNQEVT